LAELLEPAFVTAAASVRKENFDNRRLELAGTVPAAFGRRKRRRLKRQLISATDIEPADKLRNCRRRLLRAGAG